VRRGGAGHSVPILLCLSPVAGALRGLSTADTSSLTTRRDPAHYPLHYPFALRRSIAGKLPAITGAAARVPFDWTNSRASSTARNYYEQSSHQASTLWHTPHVCQTSAVLSQPGHFSSNIIISPSTAGGGPAAAHLLELPAAAAVCDGHLRVAAQPARQPHHAGPALLPVLGARCSAADGWGTIPEFYRLLFPSPCLHIHCCSFADPCVTSVLLGAAADRRRGHVLVQHRYALSRHTRLPCPRMRLAQRCQAARLRVCFCRAASTRLAVWAGQIVLLPTQHIYGGPGTSWDWLSRFGGGSGSGRSASGEWLC